MKRDPRLLAPPTLLDQLDPVDYQAINEYLRGLECRRLVLARELDDAKYWQACGVDDVDCDICEARERRGVATLASEDDLQELALRNEAKDPSVDEEGNGGGLIRYRRRQMQEQHEMDEYLRRLSQVKGNCVICRILTAGSEWKHGLANCPRAHKWRYIRCKDAVLARSVGRQWIKSYTACYMCVQPQSICRGWAVKERVAEGCEYRDLVMPTMWALWEEDGEEKEWMKSKLEVEVSSLWH